jgi:nicotinate-nucleotide adenylyltransferase
MTAAAGERLGVFGGTFNPIHLGHLHAAEEVREQLDLERMLLVPSAEPPHKTDSAGDPLAPAELRLAWARAAVADSPKLEVDPLEIERDGPSYTIDTLRVIAKRTAPEPPVFVIGCDAFALMSSWREPEALFEIAHVAVMARPPFDGSLADWLPECARPHYDIDRSGRIARHRRAPTWIRAVDVGALDISSSDVRERIRKGRSIRYLVPEGIRQAILDSRVYEAPSDSER